MDAELERSLGVTLSQFVKEKGWKEFRRVEVQLLQSVLQGERGSTHRGGRAEGILIR